MVDEEEIMKYLQKRVNNELRIASDGLRIIENRQWWVANECNITNDGVGAFEP